MRGPHATTCPVPSDSSPVPSQKVSGPEFDRPPSVFDLGLRTFPRSQAPLGTRNHSKLLLRFLFATDNRLQLPSSEAELRGSAAPSRAWDRGKSVFDLGRWTDFNPGPKNGYLHSATKTRFLQDQFSRNLHLIGLISWRRPSSRRQFIFDRRVRPRNLVSLRDPDKQVVGATRGYSLGRCLSPLRISAEADPSPPAPLPHGERGEERAGCPTSSDSPPSQADGP
jgi:hypothetical protein